MEQVRSDGSLVTLIHYVHQEVPERVACMPNMVELGLTAHHRVVHRSNSTLAVTCPACKATDFYKEAKKRGA